MNDWGVGEYWMLAVTGGLFLAPFIVLSWLLDRTPEPGRGRRRRTNGPDANGPKRTRRLLSPLPARHRTAARRVFGANRVPRLPLPFSSFLFDRIMAATKYVGTAVFGISLADAVGYTGSVAIQLHKDLYAAGASRLEFFVSVNYGLALGGSALLAVAAVYFLRQVQETSAQPELELRPAV